jgi:hypothetical protein
MTEVAVNSETKLSPDTDDGDIVTPWTVEGKLAKKCDEIFLIISIS